MSQLRDFVLDKLLSALIARPLVIMSALAFCIVAGAIAYAGIPKEQEPDIDAPFIVIDVALEGVSPLDAERLLARPLEEYLDEVEGLKELRTTSFQGGITVSLEFFTGTDTDITLNKVRTKIDEARSEMPREIEEPRVFESGAAWRSLMTVALTGNIPQRIMTRYAKSLRDAIMTLQGVLSVDIAGLQEEIVEIVLDPTRVQSYRLNNEELSLLFARANRLVAAGRLDTGQGSFTVSVPGLFETASDILNMPLKANGNAIVRVRDIASVRRTFKDPESIVRIDGQRGIALDINKLAGANMIETADRIYRLLDKEKQLWPSNLKLQIARDGTRNMKGQFYTLQNSVILAIFLVMILVIASLGVRSGLLVGLSIPGSFLSAVLVLSAAGITLSVPVMFGMIIAVGLLVDGAIVVVEYADRKMAEGLLAADAYTMAAQRMAWPTVSSTATTIAAFSPLLFWPGMSGQLMSYIPLTLDLVLLASLLMALVFVPTLGSLVVKRGNANRPKQMETANLDEDTLLPATAAYVRLLRKALKRPGKIVAGTIAILITTLGLYAVAGNGVLFFPRTEPVRIYAIIHALGNFAVEEKDSLISDVADRYKDMDDFESIYAQTAFAGDQEADDVIGRLTLNLNDWRNRRDGPTIVRDVIERTRSVPGVMIEIQEDGSDPFRGKPVNLEFSGLDLGKLEAAVDQVRRGMEQVGGFESIDDSRPVPGIEWRLEVDRIRAARFGTDLVSVGNAVRMITNGLKLGTYRPDDSDDEIDILVRYPLERRSMGQLEEMRIQTTRGLVPISNFVTRQPVQPAKKITRVDRRRVMTIASNVARGRLPNDQVNALKVWLEDNPIDPEIRLLFRGEQEEQEQGSAFLSFAFVIALFLMAAILLVQFNSFYSVALILSSVILSTTGVLFGYLITGQPFVIMMSGLGIIALAGIVVNNNIVLIDTYNRLEKTMPSAIDAIIQTGIRRLRPVVLTTVTTCLGLLPMACMLTINIASREITMGAPATLWWQQLAVTVIFGLVFATALTLVVTPCALMLKIQMAEARSKANLSGNLRRRLSNVFHAYSSLASRGH